MTPRLLRPSAPIALAGVLAIAVAILLALGRPPICTCGTVELWGKVGPRQSQMLADWYSFSHIVHGFLFYLALRYAVPGWPVERRFLIALLVETAWEVVENTPLIIDRYREATIALGYSGDTILNSVSDIVMMTLGFFAARKLPSWTSALIVLGLEIIALLAIRDNLALNILMLVAPSDIIRSWQSR